MSMACEFDHLFICIDIGADVAVDRLTGWGLLEGSANTHPGQGTANRRFFFDNAMLELLWVEDEIAARSPQIERMGLWERWEGRKAGACPLGICVRPTGDPSEVVFPNWAYQPPYLPPGVRIAVGTNSQIVTEPLLFQIPFGQRPDRYTGDKIQPLAHPIGTREITRVELVTPHADDRSPALQALLATDLIRLRWGKEYCLELGFDGELRGQSIDFRSDLPLIINW
jgi:hypothetical protein